MSAAEAPDEPIYTRSAADYLTAGWNPIPVDPGSPSGKSGIPSGVTGYRGRRVTSTDVTRWSRQRGSDNIAVRAPAGVVGIDVDQYDDKRGDDHLRELEADLGQLPPTWASSNRAGTRSAIYWYRIPVGVRFPTRPCADVEFIQQHHRYGVVWPSIHKSGRQYRWYDDSGEESDRIPAIDELTDLPWPWVERFQRTHASIVGDAATTERVAEFIDRHTEARSPGSIKGPTARLDRSRGSRHDSLLEVACWMMREVAAGYYSAREAVETLERWWTSAVEVDRLADTDTNGLTEFGNVIAWAVGQVDKHPERIAELRRELDERSDLSGLVSAPTPPPGVDPVSGELIPPPPDDDQASERLVRIDTGPAWRGERERPTAAILCRSDGIALFPVGVGYIFGDSGDGKSWLMLVAALQQMRQGRAVVWVTYEDPNEADIVDRLKLLGATEADLDHLHLFAPDNAFGVLTFELARYCRRVDAVLVVLDSVGEANAVEGVNEDKDAEWGPWARYALRRLYDLAISDDWDEADGTPPCSALVVAPIDHSTKSKDNPHFPSGTKRKRAMVTGLMVSVNVREPFARDQVGRVQLVCSKDRTGRFRRGEIVAEIVLDATTIPYDVTIWPPREGQEMSAARKRNATDRVLEVLNNTDQALTAEEVRRIANSDTNRQPGEADIAPTTVRNTLSKLTGVVRESEPTGVGTSYVIKYRAEGRAV